MLIALTRNKVDSLDLIKKTYKKYVEIYLREEKDIKPYYQCRKPIIEGDNLFCSIAHSNEYTFCAIASKPVGIDVEQMIDRDFPALSKRFIKKEIIDKEEFYKNWTRAEARYKCEGGEIIDYLKEPNDAIPVFQFLNGYMIALCSKSCRPPLFIEFFGDD